MKKFKYYKHKRDFKLESGQEINDLNLAYHTFGELNKTKSNVVWVFHGFSSSSNVLEWWPGLFGENFLFDPKNYFIVCANTIGSPYGSTAPKDLSFPQFTTRDVVNAHLLLSKHLKIDSIEVAIGGSFGGSQALEFAYSFQGKLNNLILLASSERESAWAIGIHEAQRLTLQGDATFGEENGGLSGMKAARAMAMLTYRSSTAFINQQTDKDERLDNYRASSYINSQGEKFLKRFSALPYYYLTKCLDTHDIGRGRGGEKKALKEITSNTLVIGISSDLLIPTKLQKYMAKHIRGAVYKEIESDYGHDGFLVETEKLTKEISNFLWNSRLCCEKKVKNHVII